MLALYSSASLARDAIAIAYYNVILTAITIVVAVVIGTLQVLGLVVAVVGEDKLNDSQFWRGVIAAGDRYDIIGGAICGLFLVSGISSVLLYKPWRRWVDRGKYQCSDEDSDERHELDRSAIAAAGEASPGMEGPGQSDGSLHDNARNSKMPRHENSHDHIELITMDDGKDIHSHTR